MAAYTLEIAGSGSPYIFDGSAHIQPALTRSWAYEYNGNVYPAVVAAELEMWTLTGFVFTSATPGDHTTDIAALVALLSGKSTQVSSVTLKYNGSAVAAIDGSFHQIMVKGLRQNAGPGSLVNHWEGDLSIVGRKLLGDGSGIVSLNKKQSDTYDAVGLQRQVLTGTIEVLPGTDVTALVKTYGLTSLGNNFVFTTGGPGNIDIVITNPPTNTKAEFKSEQIAKGENLPTGALDWGHDTTVTDSADGRVTSTGAVARASVLSTALSAARSIKPTVGVLVTTEKQDATSLTVTVQYGQRAARPAQAKFYGATGKINFIERVITIEGGGTARMFTPINGYPPYVTIAAQREIIVRERIRVRAVGIQSLADIPLPALLFPVAYLQPSSVDGPPYRTDKAEQAGADSWSRDASRVYAISTADTVVFADLFTAIINAPTFLDGSDFAARTAVVTP